MRFGTGAETNLRVGGAATRFPALTAIRTVASPIHCKSTAVTFRVLRKNGPALSVVEEGIAPWEDAYESLSQVIKPIEHGGNYTLRVLCGADAIAVGDFSVDCIREPHLMSEWLLYIGDTSCVDAAYVCKNFGMEQMDAGTLTMDMWPVENHAPPQGNLDYGAIYALRRFFSTIRTATGCDGAPTAPGSTSP